MSNMMQEFGSEYFYDRFGHSFFFGPNGETCYINPRSGNRSHDEVTIVRVEGPVERVRRTEDRLPADFFADMNVLRGPELGWRIAAKGKLLTFLSRDNHSYQRGYSHSNIKMKMAPHTDFLRQFGAFNTDKFISVETKCRLTMQPEYMSMAQGLEEMNAGARAAFVLNPEIAVVPESEETYALLGRSGVIGSINCQSGAITMAIPVDLQHLLEPV